MSFDISHGSMYGGQHWFGEADYRAALSSGKTNQEIKDYLNGAGSSTWAFGSKNRAGGGGWYDELERNIASEASKPKQGGAIGIKDPKSVEAPGAKPVDIPSINKPEYGNGNVSPHDFASDYMKKIMDARNNGQDPLRYDKEAGRDTAAPKIGEDTPNPDGPYDANRYKNTQFSYDKDAINYKSPQYTG